VALASGWRMFINSHREAGPSGDFDGEPMSRHLHAWISSLEWPNQGSRSPFPDSQPHVRRDHPSMGKAAPTASPCDAGCDADTDGQIWHTSSPPASPAAVGSCWFAQRNPSPCMASHSCNVAKLDENALTHSPRRGTEDRNAEPALGRMPHLRATLSPVSWWVWLLATPVHPLRDAVDILDDFGFVDIPAASMQVCAHAGLGPPCGPQVADLQRREGRHGPRTSPRLEAASGTAVRPGRPW
jgi:hypothetical protein